MSKLRDAWDKYQGSIIRGFADMDAAITEAEETIARLQKLDAEAAKVETIICLRTHFTGDTPYVGWGGLALALTETLDRLTRERDEAISEVRQALDTASAAIEDYNTAIRERDEARSEVERLFEERAEYRDRVSTLTRERDEVRAKVMDRAIAAANLCSYDMGTDPETGPIGCKLVLSGGECVCAGIIASIAGDKP